MYSVSHYLRAPITSVLGLIQIARLEKDRETVDHYIHLQEKSLPRPDKFMTDILAYSRNSRVEILPEIVCLQHLAFTVFHGRALATYQTTNVRLQITADCHTAFASDKYRLSFILHNLIASAIQYQQPYSPYPQVKMHVAVSEQEALLAVEDNGMGIAEKYLDKILDMFYRGTDQDNGSGLGLYIVKEAVDKLKGTISVASKVGEATRFLLKVPNLCSQLATVPQV